MALATRRDLLPAPADLPRPLAFVLSGGGAVGCAQVGHLLALRDAGIVPDVIVGTSVGAINGAVVAADPIDGPARLASSWLVVRREDVFPLQPLQLLASLRTHAAGVLPASGLLALVGSHLAAGDIADLAIPLHVVATDAVTGDLVDLCSGLTVDALLASSAIPGVFPPVHLAGRVLMDGALVANVPVDHAFDLGVRSAIVLDASGPCEVTRPPETFVESITTALRLLTRSQADAHMQAAAQRGLVVHLPTPCTTRRSALDFSGVDELIRATRTMTAAFLAERVGQPWPALGAVGRPHRHGPDHVCEVSA